MSKYPNPEFVKKLKDKIISTLGIKVTDECICLIISEYEKFRWQKMREEYLGVEDINDDQR